MGEADSRGGRRRAAWTASALLVGLALMGCATTRLDERYARERETWERSATAPPALDEPLPEMAVLERDALVREVLRRNPRLHAARFAWRAALEGYPQARSLEDPGVALGFDDGPAAELSQRLPFAGKLRLRGEMALAQADAAQHELGTARLRLAALASRLHDESWLLARALEIEDAHLRLVGELSRVAAARYEAGRVGQQEPLRAEAELAGRQRRRLELATEQRVTVHRINALLHREPEAELPPLPATLALPEEVPLDPGALEAEAREARPELQAAGARVAARKAAVGLARRGFIPDLTLRAGLNMLTGVGVELPLQVARRRAALEEARARELEARSERERVEDDVRLSIHHAVARVEEAREALRIVRDRELPAAADRVAAARAGFETGQADFRDLIEAERAQRDAELALATAQVELSRRWTELERAAGRLPGERGGATP